MQDLHRLGEGPVNQLLKVFSVQDLKKDPKKMHDNIFGSTM